MNAPFEQTGPRTEHTDFVALARHLDLVLERPLGRHAWLSRTRGGALAVLKSGPGASNHHQKLLTNIRTLYPPFDYPRMRHAEPDFYLVYDFIPGDCLSGADFESEAALTSVFELCGRITALFRSLTLAPMFQGLQGHGLVPEISPAAQRLEALGANLDRRTDGLARRRWEAVQSYAWAQEIVPSCSESWPAEDSALTPPWAALQALVATVTSIHLTDHGSNLAHTRMTPEHLILTDAAPWGVVGWQVAPRPYNYMRYRYLAWCLVHSAQGDPEPRYRYRLGLVPTIHAAAANILTFVLALLETWVEVEGAIAHRNEKLRAILSFVDEALALPVAET